MIYARILNGKFGPSCTILDLCPIVHIRYKFKIIIANIDDEDLFRCFRCDI